MTTTELVKRETVESLCRAHADAVEDFRAAGVLIARGVERINSCRVGAGYSGSHYWPHNCTPSDLGDEKAFADIVDKMKRAAWGVVINATGLKNMVSVADRQKIDAALAGDSSAEKLPELTPENVWGWLGAIGDQLPKLLADSVREVFQLLRPRRREEFKTNSQYEIGKRVIVHWMGYPNKWDNHPKVSYRSHAEIIAVDNVFHLLDGKGPVKYPGGLLTAMQKSQWRRDCPLVAETEYFKVTGYKKGTSHCEFKRLDLLDELNRIAGGGALKHDNKASKEWQKPEAGTVACHD